MKMKKVVLSAVCAGALVVGTIAGTMAYLTSATGTVTNTFTAGNVAITLDEAKTTEYGVQDGDTRVQGNTYKLIPGHNYMKDPTVHVDAKSETSWLFVKVVNGLEGAEIAADEVTTGEETIAEQMAGNWTVINEDKGIYAYNVKVNANENVVVFNDFTVADNVDVNFYKDATITIEAYAVQADGFETAAAAWANAPLNAWL